MTTKQYLMCNHFLPLFLELYIFVLIIQVLSVNLFGTIHVTKAFLPLIRKSKGRIVNVSSIVSRAAQPFIGPYCISKSGVEAFSEVLRLEMKQFNVKVIVIQPGNFMSVTNVVSACNDPSSLINTLWEKLDDSLRQDYGKENMKRYVRGLGFLKRISVC